MTTITTRAGKGSALTNTEVDTNFTNLNSDKFELGQAQSAGVANAIVYLNASKQPATSSSVTFDGSTFAVSGALQTTSGAANYVQVTGAAANVEPVISAQGSDTNVSIAFRSKGTGGVDLAAGSTGISISNGTTVTAITRTNNGSGYTSIPAVTVSAPSTTGGAQATASATMFAVSATVQAGGSGYTLNDVLTISGGTFGGAATFTASGVSGGVVTAVTLAQGGSVYSVLPTNPVTTTGGTGSGCTLNITSWGVSTIPVGNAGSGYVEQPTITFSGGGGSGAAAYATVGSIPVVRSLGSSMSFSTPGGEQLRLADTAGTSAGYVQITGATAAVPGCYISSSFNSLFLSASNNANIRFFTNGAGSNEQFRVSNTASAVNYVQVTGGATNTGPTITATGSDANVAMNLSTKGTAGINFYSDNSGARQFRVERIASSVNFLAASGAAAGAAPSLSVSSLSSDSNVSMALQSKGTGAIDLAAGSSGINVSNGTTVTAITRTAAGTGYTSPPTWTAAASQTGGTQASGSVSSIGVVTATVSAGGTGYTVGDVLTVSGGTQTTASTLTVATVSSGAVATVTISNAGVYTASPSNPASVTGGTGSGATFTLSFGINASFTITQAGTGYVEQPTITFSGGGGSGAAAYATVGAASKIQALAATLPFATAAGTALELTDSAGSVTAYVQVGSGGANQNSAYIRNNGTAVNPNLVVQTKGTGQIRFQTNALLSPAEAFYVAHTASAVNYVQVTGSATTAAPTISAQGSDTNAGLNVAAKGTGSILLRTAGTVTQFAVANTASAANYLQATGAAASSSPSMSAQGSDSNIDLILTPKGTGVIQFGTHTGTTDTAISGYITIKDSGGTTRKLAVIT